MKKIVYLTRLLKSSERSNGRIGKFNKSCRFGVLLIICISFDFVFVLKKTMVIGQNTLIYYIEFTVKNLTNNYVDQRL